MNLKKMERYLRVNLLGPGPRLVEKRIYRAAVSQRLSNTALHHVVSNPIQRQKTSPIPQHTVPGYLTYITRAHSGKVLHRQTQGHSAIGRNCMSCNLSCFILMSAFVGWYMMGWGKRSLGNGKKVKWSRYRLGVARGIALLFHDRGTGRGWVVSSTPRPYFTPGKDPVSILQEAGWALGPVWTGGTWTMEKKKSEHMYLTTLF